LPTYEQEIIREAQTLARLRSRRSKLKRELKALDCSIRDSKRTLKVLISAKEDWQASGARSKLAPDGGN
jgi:uncharacterized protein YeeX (DUF496 family)